MKSHINPVVALLAAGTFSVAIAQAPPASPAPASPSIEYVAEAIASAVSPQGPAAEVEAKLVQALNAETSLKGAKIAVAVENDTVLLTGVTLTKAQREKASEIAIAQLGEGKVANAIQSSEV